MKRRAQILVFIDAFCDEHGYPPTVREIAEGVGLTSPSTVVVHIRSLAAEGLLTYVPCSPRTLRVAR